MVLHKGKPAHSDRRGGTNPFYTGANPAYGAELSPPRERLLDDPLPPDTALQLVRDELMLDGNARLNLATFVTTWMEPQAVRMMAECVD
jgi:glutamate decarboxylase